jgi:hypothetical protein
MQHLFDKWSRTEKLCLLVHLVVVVWTAWVSEMPFQLDEHFQIVEFASYKHGWTPAAHLPWEFRAGIRGWLVPMLAWGVTGIGHGVGFSIGNSLAVWRVAAALFATFALVRLIVVTAPSDGPRAKRHTLIVLTTAFLPYLAARAGSEGLSASFFAVGLSLLVSEPATLRRATLSGFLFALAFAARMQSAVMILGISLWHLYTYRNYRNALSGLLLGGALGTLLQLPIDYWGYGRFSLPMLGYVRINIVEGVAAKFSTAPWYAYLYLPVGNVFIVSALIAYIASILVWIRFPKHPLTWAMIPSLALHMALSHKEERFLFPLAMFAACAIPLAIGSESNQAWVRSLARLTISKPARVLWLCALVPAFATMLHTFHWNHDATRARAEAEHVPPGAKLFLDRLGPTYYPIYRLTPRLEFPWDPAHCTLREGDYFATDRSPPAPATLVWSELPSFVSRDTQERLYEWTVAATNRIGEPIHPVRWVSIYRITAPLELPNDGKCVPIVFQPIATQPPS